MLRSLLGLPVPATWLLGPVLKMLRCRVLYSIVYGVVDLKLGWLAKTKRVLVRQGRAGDGRQKGTRGGERRACVVVAVVVAAAAAAAATAAAAAMSCHAMSC